jgi:hypothetical protein
MKIQRAVLAAIAVAVLSVPVGAGTALARDNHDHGSHGHSGNSPSTPSVTLIASGLRGTIGGAIGPDGALYVPESAIGQITRVDPESGATSVFASGLPVGLTDAGGGVIDVAFVGHRAYALVSLVGTDVGGSATDGIYQLRHDGTWKVIADLGAFSAANPPRTVFDFANGLQFALEAYRGGFIVSDGNHNRLLRVDRHGTVSVLAAFENIVPTGLAVGDGKVYVAEAGPAPHDPSTGKVVSVALNHRASTRTVASGVGYLVDAELGKDGLYALSIGLPTDETSMDAAVPNTGSIVRATRDGGFVTVASGLNLPTSMHFTRDGAILVVTLTGDVWRVEF